MISCRRRSNVQITSHEWVLFFFGWNKIIFFWLTQSTQHINANCFFFLIFIHLFNSSDFSFTFTHLNFIQWLSLHCYLCYNINFGQIWFINLRCRYGFVCLYTKMVIKFLRFLFCFYIFWSIAFILNCKVNRFCFIRKKLYPYWQ